MLLDSDLAALYGVPTKRFNEAVKRNVDRFPEDFSFMLEDQEVAILRSQFATSSWRGDQWGGRRYRPRVFTEHGAIMAAMVLNSASNAATLRRLESLEPSVAALDAETRKQFDQVHEAILGLMVPTPRRN